MKKSQTKKDSLAEEFNTEKTQNQPPATKLVKPNLDSKNRRPKRGGCGGGGFLPGNPIIGAPLAGDVVVGAPLPGDAVVGAPLAGDTIIGAPQPGEKIVIPPGVCGEIHADCGGICPLPTGHAPVSRQGKHRCENGHVF